MNRFKLMCFTLSFLFVVLLVFPQTVEGKLTFKSPTEKTICKDKGFKIKWEFTPNPDLDITKLSVMLCQNGSEMITMKTFSSSSCCFRANSCCFLDWNFKGTPFIGPRFSFRILGHKADNTKVNLGESHQFTISNCSPQLRSKINSNNNVFQQTMPNVSQSPSAVESVFKITKVTLKAIPTELTVSHMNRERKNVFAEAYISVLGKGTVVYKWVNYNGGATGEKTLRFENSGTKRIDISWEWSCGSPHLTNEWKEFNFTLKIISPEAISKTVYYKARCQ